MRADRKSMGNWAAALALVSVSACAVSGGDAGAGRAPAASAQVAAASAEEGRQLFDVHCAKCHGSLATGTASGPNLLVRVRGMSEDGFVSAVLQRYRFSLSASEGKGESSARDAMLRGLMQRQQSGGMPAWEHQAEVSQGVRSLYAFLGAGAR